MQISLNLLQLTIFVLQLHTHTLSQGWELTLTPHHFYQLNVHIGKNPCMEVHLVWFHFHETFTCCIFRAYSTIMLRRIYGTAQFLVNVDTPCWMWSHFHHLQSGHRSNMIFAPPKSLYFRTIVNPWLWIGSCIELVIWWWNYRLQGCAL